MSFFMMLAVFFVVLLIASSVYLAFNAFDAPPDEQNWGYKLAILCVAVAIALILLMWCVWAFK